MNLHSDLWLEKWAYRALAVGCVLLIAFTGFVAAVHVHANTSAVPNHACSVCALAHSGVAPAVLASHLPVFARSALLHAPLESSASLHIVPSQFIRPPPLG
jgi:hypothetical protein